MLLSFLNVSFSSKRFFNASYFFGGTEDAVSFFWWGRGCGETISIQRISISENVNMKKSPCEMYAIASWHFVEMFLVFCFWQSYRQRDVDWHPCSCYHKPQCFFSLFLSFFWQLLIGFHISLAWLILNTQRKYLLIGRIDGFKSHIIQCN